MTTEQEHLDRPVSSVARSDVTTFRETLTVEQALASIRMQGIGEKIVYFYVTDAEGRLSGVVPTRRLLTAPLNSRLSEIMLSRVMAIPNTASVLEACEAFVMHKFLAFPVIDENRRITGVVDVSLLTEEAFDVAERDLTDALFERIGFRVSQLRDASPWRAFRFRFPWLLATVTSGSLCALLAQAFESTLAKSLILAFFLTLVLGLGESVSAQSMTVTIQSLRAMRPTWRWYLRALRRESGTAALLGAGCGGLVCVIVSIWRGSVVAGGVIGGSVFLALCAACFFGLSVPAMLHALKLDPKIAAGPVTLALTDLFTLLFYFGLAAAVL